MQVSSTVIKQRETTQLKRHLLTYLPVDHLAQQLHTHKRSGNFPAARRHKYRTNLYKLATVVGAGFKYCRKIKVWRFDAAMAVAIMMQVCALGLLQFPALSPDISEGIQLHWEKHWNCFYICHTQCYSSTFLLLFDRVASLWMLNLRGA